MEAKSAKEKAATVAKKVSKNMKGGLRYLLMKLVGLALALVFLSLSVLFLAYAFTSGVSTSKGVEAKVVSISSAALGGCRATSAWGGLFKLGVGQEGGATARVYALYPSLPQTLNPSLGDVVKVWPAKTPRIGAPGVEGWEWLVLGVLVILGFILLEFGVLSLQLR